MKNLILIFALFAAVSVQAQEPGHIERKKMSADERTEKVVNKLKTELELSEEQVAKVSALVAEREKERERKHAEMKEQRKQMHEEMKQKRAEFDAEMKAVLTAEQYDKMIQMREEHKQEMIEKKHKHREGRPGPRQ